MPNPGKPHALKLLTGSRRVSKTPPAIQFEPITQAIDPPPWVDTPAALKEWHRLAPMLTNCGLLSEASLSALAHLCMLHGALARSWAAGEAPKAATVSIYRQMLNDFGMTPASLPKAKPQAKEPGANRFSERGSR